MKKYDDAETSFKKALELDAASKKPNPAIQGMANSGLGEIYARTGKVPEANAAYDAAAKANPASANLYLKNQAVIFFQAGNGDAQVAAADKAIKTDPSDALLYYLKGQGLIQKATFDQQDVKDRAAAGMRRRLSEVPGPGAYGSVCDRSAGHSAAGWAEGELNVQGRQEVSSERFPLIEAHWKTVRPSVCGG